MKTLTKEEQFNKMTLTSIPKLITSLAIPSTISMLITVIYNTADTFFVSQINKSASAGVSVCFSIMAIIQAIGFGFGMGAGSLISVALGEKKDKKADTYASSAFFSAIIIGFFIGIIPLLFIENVLIFLGTSTTMMPYALPYAKVILAISPLYCASFVLNNILRSEGKSKMSMWGISLGSILNVILDPILIFKYNLGTMGAALATAIGQTLSFLILIFFFLSKRTVIKLSIKSVSKNIKDYLLIISTGLPTIFRQGLGSVASALLNKNAVIYGDEAVAAITIATKIYMLIRNLVIGIGQGFQPVAGYNYGAGKKRRTTRAFVFSTLLGTALCVLFTVFTLIFPNKIMSWFIKDRDVIEIGVKTLKIFCFALPFMALSTYTNQLFQCLGFKLPATILASCRQGIFFIPLILFLPKIMGITGVMATQSIADILTFIISVPFLFVFYNKHLK